MFARFRLAIGEINVNVTNIKHFVPGSPTDNTTSTIITFTDNTSVEIPFSCQSVRTAMKKALAPSSADEAPATPAA